MGDGRQKWGMYDMFDMCPDRHPPSVIQDKGGKIVKEVMAHDVSLAAMFYLNFLRPKTMFLSPIPVCLYSITVSDFHSVSVPETSQSAEKTWWWLTWWPTKKEKRQTWSWTWWPTWWLVTGVG